MTGNKEIVIYSTGVVTPVGVGTKQTAASARAGISRFSETAFYSKNIMPLVMSFLNDDLLPDLHPDLILKYENTSIFNRMLQLATPAFHEVIKTTENKEDIPLYLGVYEKIEDSQTCIDESFIQNLSVQTETRFNIDDSRLFPSGRAAGLLALEQAVADIRAGKYNRILVGGIDTYCDAYTIGILNKEDRILAPETRDGFLPGEGAGFILIGNDHADTVNEPLAIIKGIGTGLENGHRYSDDVYRGDGLSDAFEHTFTTVNESEVSINTVFAGFNGESFNAKEWGVASLRHQTFFDENYDIEHPVESFGDPGAALGIIMIAVIVNGFIDNYIKSPCLIWCSSDKAARGAALLEQITT